METYDGFPAKEWIELASIAMDRGLFDSNWIKSGILPKSMADHQLRLRERAAKKFSDADRWIWTAKLFEQSSDEKVAALMASAFPANVHVIDFCCGAGSDTVALTDRGAVTAVDRSSVACEIARANLAMHSALDTGKGTIVCASAESFKLDRNSWVHVDPDRRADSRRTIQASFFQPDLNFLKMLIDQTAGGSIKLAPATKIEECYFNGSDGASSQVDIDFEKIGRQFVAWGGSVRQQRWWWNVDRYPADTVTVSVLDRRARWYHWTIANREVIEKHEWLNIVDDLNEIEGYIGDADGCVRAAGLQSVLAARLNASRIGSPVGYFLTNRMPDPPSPLIDWFQIKAVMPLDRKKVRSYLREQNIGVLEIKVRNAEIAPELLRKEMKLEGSEEASLLVTKCGARTIAIVANRFDATR